jgi:hypothetical protein
VLELTGWFNQSSLRTKPWLVLGKGPTFERRDRFDLDRYNLLALNHVVNELSVDVAHVIDIEVVGACAGQLRENARWLLMPRFPHVRSALGNRILEDYFDELPVLRQLAEQERLVWYNLAHTPTLGDSPVIGARYFSSEAVLNILGRMGVKTVRSLGVDGGRSYAPSFEHLESTTLLANDAPAFDRQFELLDVIADEYGLDYRPLVEPLRIFVAVDDRDFVAARVLEYSIRKSSSVPVEIVLVTPPVAPDAAFGPFRGRALAMDGAALVFGDVAELVDLPFGRHRVLCPPRQRENGGSRPAVLLVDGEHLPVGAAWVDSRECGVDPKEIGELVPPEWNHAEHYEPDGTKLLRFPDVPTQPWRNDRSPLAEVWMAWYREAVEAGAVPPHEVESLIDAGHVKPSLRSALRLAPSRRSVFTNAARDLDLAQRRIAALEARLDAIERSASWRIGSGIVRILRAPVALVRRHRRRAS